MTQSELKSIVHVYETCKRCHIPIDYIKQNVIRGHVVEEHVNDMMAIVANVMILYIFLCLNAIIKRKE